MTIADLPALLADFEDRPFPEAWTGWNHGEFTVGSEPGGHAIVLAESEEFWDDHDGSRSVAAGERLAAVHREYQEALTAAWGGPLGVDISPRLARGEPSPFTELLLDRGVTGGDFWVRGDLAFGLAICQVDKEWAIQVIAFVVSAQEIAHC